MGDAAGIVSYRQQDTGFVLKAYDIHNRLRAMVAPGARWQPTFPSKAQNSTNWGSLGTSTGQPVNSYNYLYPDKVGDRMLRKFLHDHNKSSKRVFGVDRCKHVIDEGKRKHYITILWRGLAADQLHAAAPSDCRKGSSKDGKRLTVISYPHEQW